MQHRLTRRVYCSWETGGEAEEGETGKGGKKGGREGEREVGRESGR